MEGRKTHEVSGTRRYFSYHKIKIHLNLFFYDVVTEIIEYKEC
jgi:hypothetical protein